MSVRAQSNQIKINYLKRIPIINGALGCFFLGFGMSQPHEAEMPIYFHIG